jgi:hypothetical protein
MSNEMNETTRKPMTMTDDAFVAQSAIATPRMTVHAPAYVAATPTPRMTMSGAAFVATTITTLRAGKEPTGRMAMTSGPKTAEEIAALTANDRAASTAGARSDRAAWAAGEWAIVGARRPAKRAAPRTQHARHAPMKQAAWAAGEWAMPDADANEELD